MYECMQIIVRSVCVYPAFMHSLLASPDMYSAAVYISNPACLRVSACKSASARWFESRLYGLADYQGLCKHHSMPVYSALFVGRIWWRQTAIDQTSQGEQ